ncbi:MAG TPA: hypothetical protein VFQ53_35695 [Kofleriaceae bacterium]|nr:hypothetical protein [Kofleriaceae bacterium]
MRSIAGNPRPKISVAPGMRWMLLVLVVAGCQKPHPNQCASNTTGACVNGEVCSLDRARGCQVCQCRPYDQVPQGNDPDDPTPPYPVHD